MESPQARRHDGVLAIPGLAGVVLCGGRSARMGVDKATITFEGTTLLERALVMAGPEDGWAVREARILAGLGESRYWLGEYRLASEALTRAVSLAEAHDDEERVTGVRFEINGQGVTVTGGVPVQSPQTRAMYSGYMPAITVQSPVIGEQVTSPVVGMQ